MARIRGLVKGKSGDVVQGTITRMVVNAGLKVASESQAVRDLTHSVGNFLNDAPAGETLKSLGHEVINLLPSAYRSAIEPVYEKAVYGSHTEDTMPPSNKRTQNQKKKPTAASSTVDQMHKGRSMVAKLGGAYTPGILGWINKLGQNEQNRVCQLIGSTYDANSLKALYDMYGDDADARIVFGLQFAGTTSVTSAEGGTTTPVSAQQEREPETDGEKARIVMGWIAETNVVVFKKLQDVMALSTGSDSRDDRRYFDEYLASFYAAGKVMTTTMFNQFEDRTIDEMSNITNVRANTFTKIKSLLKQGLEKLRQRRSTLSDGGLARLHAYLNTDLTRRGLEPLGPLSISGSEPTNPSSTVEVEL